MHIIFGVFGALAYLIAFWVFMHSKSAIHENLAVNLMCVGTIFIIGSGIISTLQQISSRILSSAHPTDLPSHSVETMAAPQEMPQNETSHTQMASHDEKHDEEINCPKCGNHETVAEPWNPKSYKNFTASRGLFSLAMKLQCKDCSHEFSDNSGAFLTGA